MAIENTQQINLQPGQVTEVTLTCRTERCRSPHPAPTSSRSPRAPAARLVVHFKNDATLVIKNFAEIASMDPQPALSLQDGQSIDLANWNSSGFSANQTAQTAAPSADQQAVIEKPAAKENLVVKLEPGQDYQFGFALNEPTSVKESGGQLIIAFKDGGEIIIPNYGALKGAPDAPVLTLSDGAALPISEFSDILAASDPIEPDRSRRGRTPVELQARNGFGFQSVFQSTALESLDAIGEINPTALAVRSAGPPAPAARSDRA
jgi:hypothetical protein